MTMSQGMVVHQLSIHNKFHSIKSFILRRFHLKRHTERHLLMCLCINLWKHINKHYRVKHVARIRTWALKPRTIRLKITDDKQQLVMICSLIC